MKKKRETRLLVAGFTQALVLGLIAVFALSVVASAKITTTKDLRLGSSPEVLSDEKSEGEKKEEERRQEDQKQNEEKRTEERKGETEKKEEEVKKTEEIRRQEQKVQIQTKEFESETADGQKVKIKKEDDGLVKVEVENGKLKFKYRIENGVTKLEAEDEDGKEVELTEAEEEDLASRSSKSRVAAQKISERSNFPLSLDPLTNSLIVTTPAGEKVVTVLPDQAVANLIEKGIVTRIDEEASGSGTVENVKLEVRNEELVYRVEGVKRGKLFGLFEVETPTTAFVSADTGAPIAEEKSVLTNVIRFLSF